MKLVWWVTEKSETMTRSNNRVNGFSLLELLVVLVIITLVTTLVIQGGGHLLSIRERLLSVEMLSQRKLLANHWWRASVSGMFPDKGVDFQFEPHRLAGMTHSSLMSEEGKLVSFQWQLVSERSTLNLVYQEKEQDLWIVRSWKDAQGEFRYYQSTEQDLSQPFESKHGQTLPSRVELIIRSPRGEERIVTIVPGRLSPRRNFRQMDG